MNSAAALPFVGRERETALLRRAHAEGRCAVIHGPAGVGKTALIRSVAGSIPLVVCPWSSRPSAILDVVETGLGLSPGTGRLAAREQRVRHEAAAAGRPIVLDGVGWTPPKFASFLDHLRDRVPLWISCRSTAPGHLGHLWHFLARFVPVPVPALRPVETGLLVAAAAATMGSPPATPALVRRLHRLSAGLPGMLLEILARLATGSYDPTTRSGFRLLMLDLRIAFAPRTPASHP